MSQPTSANRGKVHIKPFRKPPMDPSFIDNMWDLLKNAIQEIQSQNSSGLSFEQLYRSAYNMVLHKNGDRLYNGLRDVVKDHLTKVAASVERELDTNLLGALTAAWHDHNTAMLMIRDILMYMDRVYVQNKMASVFDLGLEIFCTHVARHPRIRDALRSSMLSSVARERAGETIERLSMRDACQMLKVLGINSLTVYVEDFMNPFLDASTKFYQMESQRFISENSAGEYLKQAERLVNEETQRVTNYLLPETEPEIKKIVYRELITNHMMAIVEMENSGLNFMLEHERLDDLGRMFTLFKYVDGGHRLMCERVRDYLQTVGSRLVGEDAKTGEAAEDDSTTSTTTAAAAAAAAVAPSVSAAVPAGARDAIAFVQALLLLREKYQRILDVSFRADTEFRKSITAAFETFVNRCARAPEFISLFIDDQLKRGLKGSSEEEVEATLVNAISLFRHLRDKDVFERYYKQHLAKRLLLAKSLSDDAERLMISKLKTECGYQFTSKLEGMFKDINLSQTTMNSFHLWLGTSAASAALPSPDSVPVDITVRVLTKGLWPTSAQSSKMCVLPLAVRTARDRFEKFYLSSHQNRLLAWQYMMSTADIRAEFRSGKKELNVSTFQMCVLQLLSEAARSRDSPSPSISYEKLHADTDIAASDLKRALQALACGKYRVLNMEPTRGREITESTRFSINESFSCRHVRIKIQNVAAKETELELKETAQKVDEDRKHQIEACIVRVMKARRQMAHANLVAEVTKLLQSRFMPNPAHVKKRIESLIEREYLERSADHRGTYRYLA